MARTGKLKKPKKSIIMGIALVCVFTYAGFVMVNINVKMKQYEDKTNYYNSLSSKIMASNANKSEMLKKDVDDDYIEQRARELDYVYQDEITYRDIGG